MSNTKKLNAPSIPRLTSIADDALVTITDKATGAVANVEFATLKRLLVPSVSTRNLVHGKSIDYYDSTAGNRTFPLPVNLISPLELKAGESVAISVDSVTPVSGGFHHLNLKLGSGTGYTTPLGPDNTKVLTVSEDTVLKNILLYPSNENGYTGLVKCTIHGVTVVRGTIPLKGWVPAPEELTLNT
ncbi:MAG: hypothetical protein K2M06_02620 [Muribaculaceae bacterium]|nr:hypothetical protein [Muribaculaceae bacterium]